MQIKDRLVIKVEDIAFGGEGVGRVGNFVVFIPFAAPEDELEIEITEVKKRFARGRILQIKQPSPFRVSPRCRYYERCGGCCYQHLDYQQQFAIKKKQVEETFRKIGKIPRPPVEDVLASPEIYHYRGKAQYHAEMTSAGLQMGFKDITGGKLLDIERCEIMSESINQQIISLRQSQQLHNEKEIRLNIWSDFAGEQEVKKGQITRKVKDKHFLVPHEGFFQNNLFLTDLMVDEVCRLAISSPINTLVDAYCGCGLFSIFLASHAKKNFGIELNEKSIKFACLNAEKENINNAEFIQGDVAKVLTERFITSAGGIDLMILDPPRSGCSMSLLKTIEGLRPQKLIYISCNPATQARDVRCLNDSGYELLSLLPVDMFPQTQHIEVIGLLERG